MERSEKPQGSAEFGRCTAPENIIRRKEGSMASSDEAKPLRICRYSNVVRRLPRCSAAAKR
jgi:hypothetical protein